MKIYGKYAIKAAAAALGIFLFCLCALSYGRLLSETEGILFYMEQPLGVQETLAVEQNIEEERELEPEETEGELMPKFCIWGQKKQQTLTNEYLNRSIQADVILLCGAPELLLEDCRVPVRTDSQGCVIDEDMAWELFGSSDAEGREIFYQGKSYTIRKIIPGQGKLFALQVCSMAQHGRAEQELPYENGIPAAGQQQTEDPVLNRITMQKPEEKSLQDMEIMWNQYGLSVTVLDMELLKGIGGACALLVPATACVYFLGYLFCQYRQQKQAAGKAVTAALGLILAACFVFMLKSRINVPDDYIPTRWSDFSFWTELWESKQEAVKLLIQIPKAVPDAGWMASFGKTVVCGLSAEVLALGSFNIASSNSNSY